MTAYSAAKAVHKTLSGTTVDRVEITSATRVAVLNEAAAGGALMYVSEGSGTDPTAAGDDTFVVWPGGSRVLLTNVCEIIGNGNAYSVEREP